MSANLVPNVHRTYTVAFAVYALCRKSLLRMMGLRGVEPLTSRLSGPLYRKGFFSARSENTPVPTARRFRGENETRSVSSSPRTHGVPAKAAPAIVASGVQEVAATTESVAVSVSATTSDRAQNRPTRREVVAPRVVAAPVAPIDPALAQVFARIPDPYGDQSHPDLVDQFVDGLLAGGV